MIHTYCKIVVCVRPVSVKMLYASVGGTTAASASSCASTFDNQTKQDFQDILCRRVKNTDPEGTLFPTLLQKETLPSQ